jgi:hypothetical protein
MKTPWTPGPWKAEIYINEKDLQLPPHIFGLCDNHQVADCCGADDTDMANGKLIAAAPELLEACEAAILALAEDLQGRVLTVADEKAVSMCRAACERAYAA